MDERPIVDLRSAQVAEVRYPDRIITLLAVPYEQMTPPDLPVPYRGKLYQEVVKRHAFRGVDVRSAKIRVNREHRRGDTVGKVVRADGESNEGLITDVRIVETDAGDEVLALAAEDMISPSVGMQVRPTDQEFDRRTQPWPTRIINRAFLQHIGMTELPNYTGAEVLSVRGASESGYIDAATLAPLDTPRLDEWQEYLRSRKAGTLA